MSCNHSADMSIHICGPDAEGSTVIAGKTWRWEFHEYLGPCFLRADGEPLKNQPGERHPVWDRFAEWLTDYHEKKEVARAKRKSHATADQHE